MSVCAVLFNGIRVGEGHEHVSLNQNDPSRVITKVGVSPQTVRADTRTVSNIRDSRVLRRLHSPVIKALRPSLPNPVVAAHNG